LWTLRRLVSFERWLNASFLYEAFKALEEAHARAKAEGDFNRAFLLGMFALLYDKAFDALREFLINVHYTHILNEELTALSITDWQVYVPLSDLLISAANEQECTHYLENQPTALSITDTSLLYSVFEAPQEAHARTRVEDRSDRAFLLRMYGLLCNIRSYAASPRPDNLERHTLRRGLWIFKYILDRL
jgi:hypothetical protein